MSRYVTDESAVHVPHLHPDGDDGPDCDGGTWTCGRIFCHALDRRPCVYCGGARCRVEFYVVEKKEGFTVKDRRSIR